MRGTSTHCREPWYPRPLREAPRWLVVEVSDSQGHAVANARVATTDEKGLTTSGVAEADGCFLLLGPAEGELEVSITATGVAAPSGPKKVRVGQSGGHWLQVTLAPGLAIRGRVVDDTGQPVPRGWVAWADHPGGVADEALFSQDAAIQWRWLPTDATGSFEVRGLLDHPHLLVAAQAGRRTNALSVSPAEASAIVTLPRPGAIRLRLAEGDAPERHRMASVIRPKLDWPFAVRPPEQQAEGAITFEGLAPGETKLTLVGARRRCVTTEVRPGEVTDLGEVDLAAGPALELRVSGDQGRDSSVKVVLVPRSSTSQERCADTYFGKTGADGRGFLRGIEPGPYTLVALGNTGFVEPFDVEVDREPGSRVIDLQWRQGGSIEGVALDLEGRRITRSVRVVARPLSALAQEPVAYLLVRRLDTEAKTGRFELTGLAPGRWELFVAERDTPLGPVVPVDVVAGKQATVRLTRKLLCRPLE